MCRCGGFTRYSDDNQLPDAEYLERKDARFPRGREIDASGVEEDGLGMLAFLLLGSRSRQEAVAAQ